MCDVCPPARYHYDVPGTSLMESLYDYSEWCWDCSVLCAVMCVPSGAVLSGGIAAVQALRDIRPSVVL